jgi:hypothetical protein
MEWFQEIPFKIFESDKITLSLFSFKQGAVGALFLFMNVED